MSSTGNIVDIVVPNQGLTVEEIEIAEWKKQVGDKVEKGEILLEFETDKSTMEMDSPESGLLTEVIAQEGDTIPIGGLIARIKVS
ncbi:MAG: lipoyl domain-containing protein [Cyclobacteriaceae bacterium]